MMASNGSCAIQPSSQPASYLVLVATQPASQPGRQALSAMDIADVSAQLASGLDTHAKLFAPVA